ncbi:hypothetical protein DM860_012159 [Cuscuta australis]|uniref:Mitochondrial import inner membrane translocase subunit n=1 Tax=Cuscuta australis TaxID=267555 RepID=A0A328DA69_9ASTE|nr:hypothetical protein DM860_012159 [Cuscuta australis]
MAAENTSSTAVNKQGVSPSTSKQPQKIVGWMEELEYRAEMFNTLTHTCFHKCISSKDYKEVELYIGENACIDRCVSKYWQVTNIIGQLLASGRAGTGPQ